MIRDRRLAGPALDFTHAAERLELELLQPPGFPFFAIVERAPRSGLVWLWQASRSQIWIDSGSLYPIACRRV